MKIYALTLMVTDLKEDSDGVEMSVYTRGDYRQDSDCDDSAVLQKLSVSLAKAVREEQDN
jgi:hypothetical protein